MYGLLSLSQQNYWVLNLVESAMNTFFNVIFRTSFTYCFVVLISVFSSYISASEIEKQFNLSEIADGNFLHTGVHVSIEDKRHDDIANIGFIIGENCVAVIDTGGSITIGTKLLESIRSKTDKPICYVINTHIHFDHILGNKAFNKEQPKFVGHYQLAEAVEQNKSFFLENYKNDLGLNPDENSIIGPDILVEKTIQLDLGERNLTLMPFPTSHSYNDLIVIDNITKTLWAGDLIFRQRIPSLTGSLKGWLKTMDDLSKLDVKKVIPGHGAVADTFMQAIEQQQKYFLMLLEETRNSIEKGAFINDAIETIDTGNSFNWLLHEQQHAGNVSKAYTELEWE
ncbi:MAG: quinoprotein relay system zinc metallohydrolase 2 [Proteobacteria bacterium]|nr:quinoprotein relay system zinc metallohydrolase 2 [Pseudomonadota bacterium]